MRSPASCRVPCVCPAWPPTPTPANDAAFPQFTVAQRTARFAQPTPRRLSLRRAPLLYAHLIAASLGALRLQSRGFGLPSWAHDALSPEAESSGLFSELWVEASCLRDEDAAAGLRRDPRLRREEALELQRICPAELE